MYFTTSDNVKIHYIDQGPKTGDSGVTMIFVPGWAYSCAVFEKQIEYFSREHRVIAIDPRGHGKSDRIDKGIHFQQQTKDLIALMDNLSIDEAVLVGWSYGAYAVWGMVRETGMERIRGIFIIDQPPKCTGDDKTNECESKQWVEYYPENVERAIQGISTDEGYRKGIENFTKRAAFVNELPEHELKKICDLADMDRALAALEFVSGASCDFTKEAKDAEMDETCHTEMIVRENWADIAVPYMNLIYPHTTVHVLGGHMMFYEFSDAFNQILDCFMRSVLSRCTSI